MEPFHGEITVQEDQNVLFKKKKIFTKCEIADNSNAIIITY
jgi:hypothetical protein